MTTRVLIAGDNSLVNLGLTTLLGNQPNHRVLAEVPLAEIIAAASARRPDVIILDIDSASGHGLEICAELCQSLYQPMVVVLTGAPDEALAQQAIHIGAAAFALKQEHASDLLERIKQAQDGPLLRDNARQQAVIEVVRRAARAADPAAFVGLTPQERHILLLVSEGHTNHEIAQALQLGEGTVRNYISHILEKLGCANRTEAAAFAVAHRLRDLWPHT